ncbi:MAG: cytochrome c3 family protein [Burkholderiaceae bacterium]
MKKNMHLEAIYRKAMFWLASLLLAAAALAPGLSFAQNAAQKNFDHLKTGFALTGNHAQTRCESCHQNGIFKGTPRDCASCHVSGMRFARGNLVMPRQHLQTQQSCDTCHTTKTFVGARFNHVGVVPGTCASCHNGNASAGKPRDHIPTSASCDTCHRTTGWSPAANFDHTGVVPGTCQTCHGAGKATGKSPQHMPTNAGQSCDDCHKTFTGWRPTAWNHTQMPVTAQCATCHSGGYPPADGRPGNHIPYTSIAAAASANCDTCHKGGYATWANGKFHSNVAVTGSCASCHTGGFLNAVGKPATSVHNGVTNCESCHNTAGWAGAKVEHSAFNASTNCASCHNGTTATAKPAGHMPTGATACFSCHNVSPAGWKPTKWTHTQMVVAGQCASCHTGGYLPADGRPANHIPYQTVAVSAAANCDACHKGGFTTWANGRFHANYTVSTSCASCHTGAFLQAVGKPNNTTHASVTGNCESCHKSTSSWGGAKVDHSTFTTATNCTTCHNGSTAGRAKPANHIPHGTTSCMSCHNVSPAQWTPTKWNHTQVVVTAQCATCHTGGYPPADGRPANHIPYQTVPVTAAANCDACHKGSTTTWANGRLHTNFAISTGCASCHTGAYLQAVGKPNNTTHAAVTGNCESCHKSTSTWGGAKVDHSTFTVATNCTTCHNGSTAGRSKPSNHIPHGTTSCMSCHNVSPAQWTPTKWNHTQVVVTAQCATCHTGGYPPADGRPANHIPYQAVPVTAAANCDSCHKGSTTTWANGRLHANYSLSTNCASCHTGAYLQAVGKPNNATHATVTGNCESCHRSTASWNTVTFAHSAANAVGTGTCDTCHNGSTAKGKSATHIPVTGGVAKCDSCHRSQASFATAVTMNHTVVATMTCKTCHNGSFVSEGTQGALAKPANHIPEVQLLNGAAMDCKACHTTTTSWGTMTMNHNASPGNGAGWCKACHQSGTNFLGGMEKKSLTHQRSTGVTDCSQSGCHRPLGNTGTAYRNWD